MAINPDSGMPLSQFKDVRNILIIKFKHIGDILLSVPTVKAVKQTFPDAAISYLLNDETAPMIEGLPYVNEVIRFDRRRGLFYQMSLLAKLRRQGFDLTVDLSGGGDRGALWSFFTGARYRIGTLPAGRKGMAGKTYLYTHAAQTPDVRRHSVIRDLEIVRPFGIDTRDLAVDFAVPDRVAASVRNKLAEKRVARGEDYAVVHPTSRWLFKCADDAVMAECIDRLQQDFGLRVVVTCGPAQAELERLSSVLSHCHTHPVVFPGELNLKELGAVLAGASLYIGVDSAPSHLAAAMNVPSIVLFGPTGAYNWGPWTDEAGENPYPLRKGIQRAGRHVVLQQDWVCVPCGKAGCEGKRVSDCLIQLTSDQILSEASRMLGR
ncbi:MAG: putative lipopolysaccharide heptosyltransferase III [Sulfuricella sp.]|nr:putative lipopolysaccharide heptosyltransferase III [Sulfuricella sp.]